MLDSIKDFFNHYLIEENTLSESPDQNLQIATAVLLIEIINADDEIKAVEKTRTTAIIRDIFSLPDDKIAELLEIAKEQEKQATDYFQFTRLINQHYSQQQKIRIVEGLWDVALSDNDLDKFEEYTIRKIADLLHITHSQFIAAKIKATTSET